MYSVIFVTGQSIILIVSHLSQESIILAVLHLCLRIVNYFHSQSPSDTGQSVIIIVTTICHRIVNHIHHKFNLKCSLSFSEQNRRELKKQQFYFSMVCLVCTKSITMHLNYIYRLWVCFSASRDSITWYPHSKCGCRGGGGCTKAAEKSFIIATSHCCQDFN